MHPYPQHARGFDYTGHHRYFLTFCTFNRAPHFTEADKVRLVESHLLRTVGESDFADLVHCFMPDHLHLAVEGRREDADLRSFTKRMKQFSGFYFKQAYGVPLWQRYGYEHVLRANEDTKSVVRYILQNPIRAHLVTEVREFRFFGSSEYSMAQLLEFCSSA
ncbi:MAG: transposase [Vicinamibacterales bacterium]